MPKVEIIEPIIRNNNQQENKKLRVAAYARVSSMDADQAESLETQKKYWKDYISKHQDWINEGVYCDQGISGTKDNRPSFQALINRAVNNELDLILTKSISRFSRNVKDLLYYLELLQKHGVEVRFDEEDGFVDFNSANGLMMLTFLGAIAQMEANNTSQHIKHTIYNRMKEGKPVGSVPYGYERDGDTYKIIEDEALVVRRIYDLYEAGDGAFKIAKRLNQEGVPPIKQGGEWVETTIRQIIANEKYKGNLVQGKSYAIRPGERIFNQKDKEKYRAIDTHPAIIKAEQWDKCQEIRRSRISERTDRGNAAGARLTYGTSKIKCIYCGASFVRKKRASGSDTWECYTHYKKGVTKCPLSKPVPEEYIKKTFTDFIKGWVDGTDDLFSLKDEAITNYNKTINEKQKSIENLIETFNKEIEKNENRYVKLQDAFLDGTFTKKEYEIKANEIEAQLENLNNTRSEALRRLSKVLESQETLEQAKQIIKVGDPTKFNEQLFRLLVNQIVVGEIRDEQGKVDPSRISWFFNLEHLMSKIPGIKINYDAIEDDKSPVYRMREHYGLEPANLTYSEHIECVILATIKDFKTSGKALKIGENRDLESICEFTKNPDGSLSRENQREIKNDFYVML